MPDIVTETEINALVDIVNGHPDGLSSREILSCFAGELSYRTLVRRLNALVESGRIEVTGKGRATRYRPVYSPSSPKRKEPGSLGQRKGAEAESIGRGHTFENGELPLSQAGAEIAAMVRRPLSKRPPVGYRRDFLDAYLPNKTFYLEENTRNHLKEVGISSDSIQPAGTYARRVLDQLLIDLSFHSSRLEGNTYSLLETKKLIAWGRRASGRDATESQMILNHKAAIEFLVESARDLTIDRRTLLNIHALLAENLLGDPASEGRLRTTPVVIGGSPYVPNEVPQIIEECFNQIAIVASRIRDPFEQSFFLLVHLPYLQPFEDVNKRVSRLAANIPLIRENLRPLSFIDVPTDDYLAGVLGVYEQNRIELLRDVFVWAYERSAERYAVIRDAIGAPDEFRLEYRSEIKEAVSEIIVGLIPVSKISGFLEKWTAGRLPEDILPRFIAVIEAELVGLHEGNYARYRITPSQFRAWIDLE